MNEKRKKENPIMMNLMINLSKKEITFLLLSNEEIISEIKTVKLMIGLLTAEKSINDHSVY